MSHRILRYEQDDEERFAVWSTVVEDWVVYDMSKDPLREWHLGKEMREASDHIQKRIQELRDGENPYMMWDAEVKREELYEWLRD